MKYLLINEFDKPMELDDGYFGLKCHLTKGSEGEVSTIELFSEADIYRIKRERPESANAIILQDDWIYWDTKANKLLGYVFKD